MLYNNVLLVFQVLGMIYQIKRNPAEHIKERGISGIGECQVTQF